MTTPAASETAPPLGGREADTVQWVGQIAAAAVAAAFIVPIGELRATTRRPRDIAFARQSAMYLAHVAFGLSYTDVGRAFDRDRTTAAHACRITRSFSRSR